MTFEDDAILGFVGQGWIGKNLADHFEERIFKVVRYGLEPEFEYNKDDISECEIVFIAVPTPTTPAGFQLDAVKDALKLVGTGKTAVIKSTILPGSTDALAKLFPDIYVLHSPEFLREASVREDIDQPERNIVGIPGDHLTDQVWRGRARDVLRILPRANKHTTARKICSAAEAEMVKYVGNVFLAAKVILMNVMYEVANQVGADWNTVAEVVAQDSRIGSSHMHPVHQHLHIDGNPGRGAGGHCFPKDLAAFRTLFQELLPNHTEAAQVLIALENYNIELLRSSWKDAGIMIGIYGDRF